MGLAWHRDQFHLYNLVRTSGLAAASISQLQVTDTDKKTARGFYVRASASTPEGSSFFFLFYLVCLHVGTGGGRTLSHDMAYMWKSEDNFSFFFTYFYFILFISLLIN